jgi:hypothetical protein
MHVLANLPEICLLKEISRSSRFCREIHKLDLNQEGSKVMSKEELQVLSEVTTQLVLLHA